MAGMVNIMVQSDTMPGNSEDILNEGKLATGLSTNVAPITILNIPSPIQEYRKNEFRKFF